MVHKNHIEFKLRKKKKGKETVNYHREKQGHEGTVDDAHYASTVPVDEENNHHGDAEQHEDEGRDKEEHAAPGDVVLGVHGKEGHDDGHTGRDTNAHEDDLSLVKRADHACHKRQRPRLKIRIFEQFWRVDCFEL
jgi:hypothetical protein